MRAVLVVFSLAISTSAFAQPAEVTVTQAWSRATTPGAQTGAIYVTVAALQSDRLISVSTPVAAISELHQSRMLNNVMEMRPVPGGLAIAPGLQIHMVPGGYHIMLMGLKRPLREGDHVPLTLMFERAGAINADAIVAAAGARGPGS